MHLVTFLLLTTLFNCLGQQVLDLSCVRAWRVYFERSSSISCCAQRFRGDFNMNRIMKDLRIEIMEETYVYKRPHPRGAATVISTLMLNSFKG
jgi:hypothetical protein